MPQRGDNPNEMLFESGTAMAFFVENYSSTVGATVKRQGKYEHVTDNFYDMDSSLNRPVEDMLSAIEEETGCPLVHLELRLKPEHRPHQCITHDTHDNPVMPRIDLTSFHTEMDRLCEFLYHERLEHEEA